MLFSAWVLFPIVKTVVKKGAAIPERMAKFHLLNVGIFNVPHMFYLHVQFMFVDQRGRGTEHIRTMQFNVHVQIAKQVGRSIRSGGSYSGNEPCSFHSIQSHRGHYIRGQAVFNLLAKTM